MACLLPVRPCPSLGSSNRLARAGTMGMVLHWAVTTYAGMVVSTGMVAFAWLVMCAVAGGEHS
jgi:hypothetical protein